MEGEVFDGRPRSRGKEAGMLGTWIIVGRLKALLGSSLVELIINLISVTSSTYKMLGSLECRSTPGDRIASSRR